MTIDLSGAETEFQSVLSRWCSEHVTSEYVRERVEQGKDTCDKQCWQNLVALGLFEVFSEAENELSTTECMLLVQEFGKCILPEPASEQLVFGAHFFSRLSEKTKIAVKELQSTTAVLASDAVATFPFGEIEGVVKDGVFNGEVSFVPTGSVRLGLLVLEIGETAFVIEASDDFVAQERSAGVDLTRAFLHCKLINAPVVALTFEEAEVVRALKNLMVSHEVAGVCKWVHETTLEYVKTRKQFGKPVGSFQAIQHMLADMHVWLESIDSLALFAAWAFDESVEQRAFSAEAAARLALEKGRLLIEKAIQAHGGIGFTWEYDLHLYLRRVLLFDILFDIHDESDSRLLEAVSKL